MYDRKDFVKWLGLEIGAAREARLGQVGELPVWKNLEM